MAPANGFPFGQPCRTSKDAEVLLVE